MSEVSKIQVKASDRPTKKEVRTGQALNAVATAGGLHAAYLTGKEITRTVRNGPEVGRHAKPEKVGRLARVARKVPGAGKTLRDPRKAALAGLGAWGVLHTGELVGDAISARALHRQGKIAKEAVVIEQSIIKSYTGRGETGHGINLETVEKASKKRPKCPNCELPCDKDGKCPMCGKDCRSENEKGESAREEKDESKREQRWERKQGIDKALRRFDSEADRQRRLGMYAGAGAGTAAVAGNELRRMLDPVRGEQPKVNNRYVKGKRPLRGVKLKAGASPRKAAVAAAVAAGGALVGIGSYKRGVSRRNQPWT